MRTCHANPARGAKLDTFLPGQGSRPVFAASVIAGLLKVQISNQFNQPGSQSDSSSRGTMQMSIAADVRSTICPYQA